MKNCVQPGNSITLTAPYAVTSGDGLLVGSIFGVAAGTAILGDPVETAVEGVYDLKKVASQAWAVGDRIYWDNTAKQTTKTLTSNTLIGVATEAVGGGHIIKALKMRMPCQVVRSGRCPDRPTAIGLGPAISLLSPTTDLAFGKAQPFMASTPKRSICI